KTSESKIQQFWEKNKIYKFDPKSKKPIFSIDTPPPTVSGKMHLGHAFSYAQQDFIVRYNRMQQKNIFYPFGTDDNGLATERLIENLKNVKASQMDRQDFINLCLKTLETVRPKYIEDWKRIGTSCDFSIYYTTIDKHCQKISQKSFIDLYKINREYRKHAPAMWCPECQTGISQQECKDKEISSYFNDIVFKIDNEHLIISTTRPELLPACVAIFYHPTDERYKKYNGKKTKVPLFNLHVPIMPDERADPNKGTGIVMCCTFGDQTDMEWQRAYNLPIRNAITKNGKMTSLAGKYEGLSIKEARKEIIEDLKNENLLISQKPITHIVNVHERCGTEIEFVESKQWFIKYLDLKKDMLKWGKKLNWYPKHMFSRYEHWVKGLQWDWLISRQRFFGIPFPVWYCSKCEYIILADEKDLPVDPIKDKPKIKKCPKCNNTEFIPEKDVLDTWTTSSLTPQIAASLFPNLYKKLYPMNLRPQAHDIITFWLFTTVVKSQLHNKINPWKDVMISGFVLDPERKKMSKSKGNVIEPQDVTNEYGSDALRFWAAGSKLGEDLPYQEKDLISGKKIIIKLWNASKFSISHLKDYKNKKPKLEVLDLWILTKLSKLIKICTQSFNNYDFFKPKTETENFFWHVFCDNYLEIVKDRLYNPKNYNKNAKLSAQYTLYINSLNILKLMAPIMPFITEEIYQNYFIKYEKSKSIHISQWPNLKIENKKAEKIGDLFMEILAKVRQFKTQKQKSLKEEVILTLDKKQLQLLKPVLQDLKACIKAKEIKIGNFNIELCL
ncbi:MAG: valine--tRNA ligase, partial [Candidatus Woesearchaeota archaeon]